MIRFSGQNIYYWFNDGVECLPKGGTLIRYQIINHAAEADFTKYHCAIFEYPWTV